jgi:AcrR family transcriptional regulator
MFILFHTFAPYMSEQEAPESKLDQIIPEIIKVFMTYGIKSVTMDDVAKHLRISKKTLYQYVQDKNDLVIKCLDFDCTMHENGIQEIIHKNFNAIDENIEISKFVMAQLRQVHPSIFYDLQKYYPEGWAMLQDSREGQTARVLHNNIKKGIQEGYFREDLHVEIQTRLWITRMNVIFDPRLFPMQEFKITEVYEQMFVHQIRGMASKKGLKYLEKHKDLISE